MYALNELVKKYLDTNGISQKFFADYVGMDTSNCNNWLKGKKPFPQYKVDKIHEFLTGSFIKTAEEIIAEEQRKEG